MAALSLGAADLSRYVHRKDGRASFEVAVQGAHCANCIARIEAGVKAVPGVTDARLNLSTGKLLTQWQGAVAPGAILQRVHDLGYAAQPFEAPQVLDAHALEGRQLLHGMIVAAFGTVFVMGLTDSVWYGGSDMSPALRQGLFWLAATVSVPLTLYAGQGFFRSAFKALRSGGTNMDVPIALAVLLALGLSLYQVSAGMAHTYFDAAVMLVFLLLVGRYLDFHLRGKAQSAARHLLALQSQLSHRLGADSQVETVASGDIAPGDRLLLASGERLAVDGALESAAADLDMSLVTGESRPQPARAGETLHAGTVNLGAAIVVRATARAQDSLLADLARLLEAGKQRRSLYVRLADRAARVFVPATLAIAALVWLGWLAAGGSPMTAGMNAVAVLLITCPCALGLAVPAVQVVATGRLFASGLLVKSGDALERLAEIDTVVFDKTGTLTEGRLRLLDSAIPPATLKAAAELARASRHPLACAVAEAAGPGPVALGVVEEAGAGLQVSREGILYRLGSAAFCAAPPDPQVSLWYRAGDQPPIALRFEDRLRADVRGLVAALMARDLRVEMLTGDVEEVAQAVARETGIPRWRSGVKPADKAARLEALRATGHRALMVGDGLNDAGAMALAHVSIAPGSAADVSQLAADMVLRSPLLSPILEGIDVARKARALVLQNFALATIYNVVAVPMAALGLITPLLAAAAMAGSSLLVTLNALRLNARWRP